MGRKKKEDIEVVEQEQSQEVKTKKKANILDTNMMSADFIMDEDQIIIPVSPLLDIGLNGGIPEGVIVSISGKPKCGKSSLCLHFCANAQQPEYGSKKIFYFDIERRLAKKNLQSIKHLDIPNVNVIRSEKGSILDASSFLNTSNKIINENPGCVIVLDSTSALASNDELTSEIGEQTRPEVPRLLAKWTRQVAQVIGIQKCIIILIQHVMDKQSYGGGITEDGGQKVQYHGDVKIRCKYTEKWTPSNADKPIGQICHWDILWGALGAPSPADGYIRFGEGIDVPTELIMAGTDLGLISKGGAWFTCDYLNGIVENNTSYKFQGQEKLRNFLTDNPEHVNTLSKQIREMMAYDK